MKIVRWFGLFVFGGICAISLSALGAAAWFVMFFTKWIVYFGIIGLVIVALVAVVIGTRRASRTVERNIDDMLR